MLLNNQCFYSKRKYSLSRSLCKLYPSNGMSTTVTLMQKQEIQLQLLSFHVIMCTIEFSLKYTNLMILLRKAHTGKSKFKFSQKLSPPQWGFNPGSLNHNSNSLLTAPSMCWEGDFWSKLCFMHHFTCWISRINRAWVLKGVKYYVCQPNIDLAQSVEH